VSNQVKDKTFMFTGTLSITRDSAREVVKELGGIPGSSITRETDYLVCGDDQVGKSNKWERAGILGITRVDEDYFWELVKEARKAEVPEEVVHLSQEELETGNITDEHWEEISKLEVRIMTTDQFERLLRSLAPSYENPEKVVKLVKEYNLELLSPTTCKFCGETIPYSIHTKKTYSLPAGVYYCFNCKQYSYQVKHHCVWFDPKIKQDYYMCSICGDFTHMRGRYFLYHVESIKEDIYSNSLECLVNRTKREAERKEVQERVSKYLEGVHLTCDDLEPLDIKLETGFYAKCKVCGKVKFVENVDTGGNAKFDARQDHGHSSDFEAKVVHQYSGIDRNVNVAPKLSDGEREKLWRRWESKMRKPT